jgi:uncharacterized membrane protein YebE (DUF533 family)
VAAARLAARELAGEFGPRVEADAESALLARGTGQPSEQFADLVAVGSLIVAIAALAWQVYRDLKTDQHRTTPEVLARATRVEMRTRNASGNLATVEEKIIVITAAEIIRADTDGQG